MMDQDLQDPWTNQYQDPYQSANPAPAPAAPAPPGPSTSFVNTSPVPAAPPAGTPGTYQENSPNDPTPTPTGPPSGGNLSDPGYAAQFVAYWGAQPGANPSVKNDPNYWIGRFTSGAFGNDQQYAVQRMLMPEGPPEAAGAPAPTGGAPAPAAPGATYNYSYTGGSTVPPGVSDQLYNLLLQRAQQSTNIDPNDPNIRQQVDPAAAQIERDRRDYLANVAESRGPLANIQGETRVSGEKAAQMKGQLEASMIGKELQSRRDEITQALTELGSRLSSDQALGLQKELAYLNNALGKYGIDTSAGLQQQQINSGNDQFASTFGLNSTNQANYWDAIRSGAITG